MRRTVMTALAVGCVLALAACSASTSGAGPSVSPSGPSSSPGPSEPGHGASLRVWPVAAVVCSPGWSAQAGTAVERLQAVGVTELVLCPVSGPGEQRIVRVTPGSRYFLPLLAALSAPDDPKSTGPCPLYADLVQAVFARTPTMLFRVVLPVDGCGHYKSVGALAEARAG